MASIVAAWPTVTLGEVLTQVSRPVPVQASETYSLLGMHWYGEGLYIKDRKPGSLIQADTLYEVREDDFVYNRLFAWKGSFGVADGAVDGCHVSNEFPCFRVDSAKLDSSFLRWYFARTAVWEHAQDNSSGSTPTSRLRLKEAQFLSMPVHLPPLDEQRRIVARIEALAHRIEQARGLRREAIAETEVLLGGVISTIFSSSDSNGWELGCLGDFVIDDCYGTSDKANDYTGGIPILRMGNIQNGRLDARDLKYIELSDKDLARFLLRKGDNLVNRTNSAELVGKCAVFDLEGKYAFASYIIRLRLDTTRADPRLVAAYINSPNGRSYMFSERKQMTGQANINSTTLRALPLSLPSLDEQRRIVAYLDGVQAHVDALKRLQAETAAELDALLPSVLDRAFRGEL